MYQPQDKVVYGIHGVCVIVGREVRRVDRKDLEYLVLEPIEQPGACYYVPAQNPAALAKLRPLLDRDALTEVLHYEEIRRDSWIRDENQRKLRYRELINSGDRAALLSMIGSLYRQKENLAAMGRKFHLCDENFLRDAEKLLHAEFSQVLGIEPGKIGEYIRHVLSDSTYCLRCEDIRTCETEQNTNICAK
jgi:CarD family transcriptional regulator